MESIMIRGTNASGMYVGRPGLAMCLQGVVMDLPNSGTLTNASVTISGAQTGAYTFNGDVTVTKQFQPNEDVYVTTSNFGANYGAIINYVSTGDMTSYVQDDLSQFRGCGYPTPWRFRT